MGFVRLFLGFEGRLSRAEFLIMGLLLAVLEQLTTLLATAVIDSRSPGSGGGLADFGLADVVNGAVMLLFLWPTLAMTAKRYHDLDKSGWWSLLMAAPIVLGTIGVISWMQDAKDTGLVFCGAAVVAFIWPIIELGTFHGSPGDNSYGPRLGWKSLFPELAKSLARSEQEALAKLAATAAVSAPVHGPRTQSPSSKSPLRQRVRPAANRFGQRTPARA